MVWLSESELKEKGIKFGKNVKIDNSCKIFCEELEIGDNCRIDAFCFLSGKIKIGRHVHISVSVTLAGNNEIVIGDFVGIAPNSYLFTTSADFIGGRSLTNPTIPKQYIRHNTKGSIILEDHVLIGSFSSIFPNSNLHEGSVFGSYSIINGEYDPWKIYASTKKNAIYRKDRPKDVILSDAKKILSGLE